MKPYTYCPFCKKLLYPHSTIRQQCQSVYDEQEISFGIVPKLKDTCHSGFIQWQDGNSEQLECISFYAKNFIIQIENIQCKTKSIHVFKRNVNTRNSGPKIFNFDCEKIPFDIIDPDLYKKIQIMITYI